MRLMLTILIFFFFSETYAQFTIIRKGDSLFLKNFSTGTLTKLNYEDIKTINGQSLSGAGNINIVSDSTVTSNVIKTITDLQTQVGTSQLVLSADTIISTTWDGGGRALRFNNKKIRGTGTLKNFIIDASLTEDILDTSINIVNCKAYNNVFSCAWYGAKSSNADNWWNIQKSINTSLSNSIPNCLVPKGVYHYSKPLEIIYLYQTNYVGVTLHFYGESAFWGSDNGSTLAYDHYADCALNLQVNKGTEIDHLNFTGQWKSPTSADSVYYNTVYANYNDVSGNNCNEWYYGIAIDWRLQPNWASGNRNGSTGLKIHDISITGFTKLIAISQGQSANGENLFFENIKLGDARVGIATGQAQEKGNWLRNIISWGRIHTVFQIGVSGAQETAGDWHIEGGNVDGAIRIFQISASGWYSTSCKGLYAENIGMIGDLYSAVPIPFYNCTFHLKRWTDVGKRIIINSSGTTVVFHDCMVRYYGLGGEIWVHGMPKIDGGLWQDAIVNK